MNDWKFAQTDAREALAQLHYFSVKKRQAEREIEFIITVREYVTPTVQSMAFVAQADKQTNQNAVPFTPSGWGNTLLTALSECIKAIHQFPYEGPVD